MEVEGGICRLGRRWEPVGKDDAVRRAKQVWRRKVTLSKAAAERRMRKELDGVIQSDVAAVAATAHHLKYIEEKKSVHRW